MRIEKWNERETEGLMNENAYREWLLEHSHSKSEGRGLIRSLGPVHHEDIGEENRWLITG